MELNNRVLKPKETKEILDYEQDIGVCLLSRGRFVTPLLRRIDGSKVVYSVCFKGAFVLDNGHYIDLFCEAKTLDEAVSGYCSYISGKRMMIDESSETSRMFDNPILVHTKLFGK